jgi:dipeptidyl aminopeptidase/acylaminoacyl peptidase
VGNESKLRDFSWFDWTNAVDLSPDGKTFVFYEAGIGGGKDFSPFLRKTDGSPPVFLGPGYQGALSPDGKWALANSAYPPAQMFLYPTGAGETRQITHDKIDHYSFAWLPDGKHVIFAGSEPGHSGRLYRMDVGDGSTRRPFLRRDSSEWASCRQMASSHSRLVPILSPASFGSTAATRAQFRA